MGYLPLVLLRETSYMDQTDAPEKSSCGLQKCRLWRAQQVGTKFYWGLR